LLAFGPLAFGAVQDWAICTLELGASACVILWIARELASSRFQIYGNALFLPIALFAGIVGVQLLTGRTAYWFVTWQNGLLWAAYAMLFFVATQCFSSTGPLRVFAFFFTAFGFLLALFAIAQQFTWNGKLYWVVNVRQDAWIYGPYVNHSHYAGLMEMLVPIPLVLAFMNRWQRAQRVLFGFAALLMASTIFLSQSVGGIAAFGVQMALFAVILGVRERTRSQVLLLLLLAVLLTVWLTMFSPGGIGQRMARLSNIAANDRMTMARDSMKMIAARPVLGWGLGTFPVVYPSFRTFYTNFFVNAAHNDYVQTAVETGLSGLSVVCIFVVSLYRRALRNIAHWRSEVGSATRLAAMIGATGILIHSFYDFNLQIPANAALFFVLSAVATAGSRDVLIAE
jgi:O-antigen ligase